MPGAAPSILDGQRLGTTLRIVGTVSARLARLIITGGVANQAGESTGRGGGLYIRSANVVLDGVVIRNNIATMGGSGRGGGIYIRDGRLSLRSSAVISNTASQLAPTKSMPKLQNSSDPPLQSDAIVGSGGGIYALNTRIAIQRSTLAGNSALDGVLEPQLLTRGWGGAIYASNCTLDTFEATFQGNDALAPVSGGGALRLTESRARLRGGEISDNLAGQAGGTAGMGGGLDVFSGTTTLTNIALRRNLAADGAGIRLLPSDNLSTTAELTLTNVLLAGHSSAALALAPGLEGAAHAEVRYATVISNSIGIQASAGQSIHLANSLLVGNDIAAQALDGGTIALDHTNRYGNRVAAEGNVQIGPAGDLALPPQFAPGDMAFHLTAESPLLDQGAPLDMIPIDFENQPRSYDGNGDGLALPDLGWDELVRSAALFGPSQTLFTQPGRTLTTTIELRNIGLAGDTFHISLATPTGWRATVQPGSAALGPRTRTSLTIQVDVPASAPLNSRAVLDVRAAGQLSQATTTILLVVEEP
jgi:hypothetical protein